MRALLVMPLFIACSGPAADGTGDTDDGTLPPTSDSGTEPDTDPPTTPVDTASLTGTVRGPAGPLADADLRFCRGVACRNASTDAAGVYTYDEVAEAWYALEVVPPEGSGLATACAPLLFAAGEARVVDVEMLPHDPPSALGSTAAEHEAGEGLHLTLAADDLEPPLLAEPADEVAGVAVPEAARPPTDGIAGTVLGMWYLEPFNHAATDPAGIPARFDDVWALTEGTALEVYVAQYPDGAWVSAGTASASAGEITGARLPWLSTVILVQP